MYTKVHIFC